MSFTLSYSNFSSTFRLNKLWKSLEKHWRYYKVSLIKGKTVSVFSTFALSPLLITHLFYVLFGLLRPLISIISLDDFLACQRSFGLELQLTMKLSSAAGALPYVCIPYNSILEKTIVEMSELTLPITFQKPKTTMKLIFAHFEKKRLNFRSFSEGSFTHKKNNFLWFFGYKLKITKIVIFFFFDAKNSKRSSQFTTIYMYKKWYIVQNSKHVPHFLPLQLMRLLFLICSQDENVQEYKRAKKGPGFPPSFSSQMSLWAAEGKSGVARCAPRAASLTALFSLLYVLPKCDQSRSGAQNAE